MNILCPFHEELTPSLAVYSDHYHCFGCGKHGPLEELGIPVEKLPKTPVKPPMDMEAALTYIQSLVKASIRGFRLPVDSEYYYLVWPGSIPYFKKRSLFVDKGSKYICPSGVRKPLFIAQNGVDGTVVVVEGEFNALSLAKANACPSSTIVSPGSASELGRYVEEIAGYRRFVIVVDKDKAGVMGGLELKKKLLSMGKAFVEAHYMDSDFNEVLMDEGEDGVKSRARKMGL